MIKKKNLAGFSAIAAAIFFFSLIVSAATGTIDATDHNARFLSDNSQINFGLSQGSVTVTDAALTGYAWSEKSGWINLAPTNGGVLNNGREDLMENINASSANTLNTNHPV